MSLVDVITEKLLTDCKPYVIEFGSSFIRKSSAITNANTVQLDSYMRTESPEETNLSHQVGKLKLDSDQLKDKLVELFDRKIFFEKYISIIVPDQAFNFGYFSVPTVAIKAGIQPLLEREIQKSSSMQYKDYSVKYEFGAKTGNKISVFFCALPLKLIDELNTVCSNSSLVPVSIQPSFAGIVKLLKLRKEEAKHPSVFLHFGNEAVTAGIFKGDGLVQIQVINIGVCDLLTRLIEDMNLTPEDAYKKLLEGIILLEDPSAEAQLEIPEYTILESVFAELLQRIYGFLLLYSNDHPEETGFSKIILSGGGTRIKNIDRLISTNIGITTTFLSKETEDFLNCQGIPESESLDTLAPLIGNALIQPWKTEKFERIFSA